jgi:hypothetical protein
MATLEFETAEERRDFARLVGMLRREWDDESVERVVLRALREAAERA